MAASNSVPRGFTRATAADVRAWGAEVGLPIGGSRGRLPMDTIDAFNKAHGSGKGRMRYTKTDRHPERVYEAKPDKGRTRRETATAPQIRAWAALNGLSVQPKGRLPKAVTEAYVLAN